MTYTLAGTGKACDVAGGGGGGGVADGADGGNVQHAGQDGDDEATASASLRLSAVVTT